MKKKGLIIDLETTGIDPLTSEIIEVGIMEFTFDDEDFSRLPRPSAVYSELQEPKQSLNDFIKNLTGLSDEDLKGRSINWGVVREKLEAADYIIAHNAQFERSFLNLVEGLRGLSKKSWACSMTQIKWSSKGSTSRALKYVAADQGFLNPFPHRAPFDVITTFKVIEKHLEELIINVNSPVVEIRAIGSDFDLKDVLKKRGYHWNASDKVWLTQISERDLDAERDFLKKEIYANRSDTHSEKVLER